MDPVMRNRPGQVPRRGGGNQFMPMPPVQDPGMMNILPAEPPQGGMPNSPDDLRPYMSPGAQPLDQYPGYRGGPNPAIGPAVMPPMPAPGVGRYGPVTGMMPPVQGQFMPPVDGGGGLIPMPGPLPAVMPPLFGGGSLNDYIGKKGGGGMPPMTNPGAPGGVYWSEEDYIRNVDEETRRRWEEEGRIRNGDYSNLPPIFQPPMPPGVDPKEWGQFLQETQQSDMKKGIMPPPGGPDGGPGGRSGQMGRGKLLKDKDRSKPKPKIGKQPPKVAYDSPPTKPPQMLPPQRDPLEYATGVQSKSLRDRKSDSRIKPTGTRQKG